MARTYRKLYLPAQLLLAWALTPLLAARPILAASPDDVQPIDWSRYDRKQGLTKTDAFGSRLARILNGQSSNLYDWIDQEYTTTASGEDARYNVLPYSGVPEWGVRPVAETAWGTSVLLKTGAYLAHATGLTRVEALHRTEKMIQGVAYAHRSNNATNVWGGDWQAALWASDAAEAAWFVWGDLSPGTKSLVVNMVENEANRILVQPTRYWRNLDGTTNTPGDTKAEEVAWDARVLSVAQAMLPNDPNAEPWREKRNEMFLAAYSRPSDLTNTDVVDGRPVKDWLNGYNMFEEGLLVNHNRLHPDYMTGFESLLSSQITNTLAGGDVPESASHNFDVVYDALTGFKFTPGASPWGGGAIRNPGGRMYRRAPSGEYEASLYYPQGTDWSLLRFDNHLILDLYAASHGLDRGKPFRAMGWADARITAIQQIQDRPGHRGNLFEAGDWITPWRPDESYSMKNVAHSMLFWWLTSEDHLPIGSLRLVVNVDTTQATIVSQCGEVAIKGYSLLSDDGGLNPAGWFSLQDNPKYSGWQEANPTSSTLSELNPRENIVVGKNGLALGSPVSRPPTPVLGAPSSGIAELRFEYVTAEGEVLSGLVEYEGLSLANNLLLHVDPVTGEGELLNSSQTRLALRGYSILSASGSLRPLDGDWNSLSDQSVAGVEESNASATALSELSPLAPDSLVLQPGQAFQLGGLFDADGVRDLELEFVYSELSSPTGDYNNDGTVDAADYTLWRDNLGGDGRLLANRDPDNSGAVSVADYDSWRENYGATAALGGLSLMNGVVRYDALNAATQSGISQTPEPSTIALVPLLLSQAAHTARKPVQEQ